MFVIYHSSDSFAEVTGISMLSLFEQNRHMERIHVLYIHRGLSAENQERLSRMASSFGRTLEFMEMPDWSKRLGISLRSSKSGWLGFGYNRLFLTEFIPETEERVLYLDSDTVIEAPLDALWETDLDGYAMAGADDCLSRAYRDLVEIGEDGTYCNAGMLLINLKWWREHKVLEQFLESLRAHNGYMVFNEQSVLNSVFSGKILVLPQKYNVNSLVYLFSFRELMRLRMPYRYSYGEEELRQARLSPVITHFTGNFYVQRRPWIEDSDHPHAGAYLAVRERSPWAGMPMARDTSSRGTRMMCRLCHVLPRPLMIALVSLLYNRIRPAALRRKARKAWGQS